MGPAVLALARAGHVCVGGGNAHAGDTPRRHHPPPHSKPPSPLPTCVLPPSYWAFEQLAHPINGLIAVESRSVDCDTGEPLPRDSYNVNTSVIYSDRTEAGWGWNPYFQSDTQYWAPGQGAWSRGRGRRCDAGAGVVVVGGDIPAWMIHNSSFLCCAPPPARTGLGGSNATCVRVAAGGGLNFAAANASPFRGAQKLSFWVRGANGGVPTLKVRAWEWWGWVCFGGLEGLCLPDLRSRRRPAFIAPFLSASPELVAHTHC